MISSLTKRLAGMLADSFLFKRGRRLFGANTKDFNHPMSKADKVMTGSYLILRDYSKSVFPPTFLDQAEAYENEIKYSENQPGKDLAQVQEAHIRKPFWNSRIFQHHANDFTRLLGIFEKAQIPPGAEILELGCGSGWMAEFFCQCGYHVTASTISHHEIELCRRRADSLLVKKVDCKLHPLMSPMESVDKAVPVGKKFKAVYVYEALHHAYDWREAFRAAFEVMEPGGWLVIANEPNRLHTFISYRVAVLTNTHEIGLSKSEMLRKLKQCGFSRQTVLSPKINNRISPHWIIARK